MKALSVPCFLLVVLSAALFTSACDKGMVREHEEEHEEGHKIVVTSPVAKDVISTQQYVCQIHSRRHIEVRALERGYLEEIHVKEGQAVEKGDVMFKIVPIVYQARMDTAVAEAQLAQIKYNNTKMLSERNVVSPQELALSKAELAKAQAHVDLTQAELNFTTLRAPFDGIIDRQYEQQGSLVEEGDILSTLSDNKVMWVYFNVPEARYLEYQAGLHERKHDLDISLKLANGQLFPQDGEIGAIEADFNNETGNIAFRADFPNPDSLLRHGQTGNILIHRTLHDAIVIPQRATYEILAKKYVYVIEPAEKQDARHGSQRVEYAEQGDPPSAGDAGDEADAEHDGKLATEHARHYGVVRQREITIQEEMDDIYVIGKGLDVNDKIIFEGIRQVRDGDEVEYDFAPPEELLKHLKHHAE